MPTIYLNTRTFTKLVDSGHYHDYEAYIEKAVNRLLEEERQVPKSTGSNPGPLPREAEKVVPFTFTESVKPAVTVMKTEPDSQLAEKEEVSLFPSTNSSEIDMIPAEPASSTKTDRESPLNPDKPKKIESIPVKPQPFCPICQGYHAIDRACP